MSGRNREEYRPLNVRDALSYLDQVKIQFVEQPDVYNRFLDVMKEFKSQIIDTPGVIDRVSNLFKGHPALIQGFNTFLPPGYRIECFNDTNGKDMIKVTTPSGNVTQMAGNFSASALSGTQDKPSTGSSRDPAPSARPSQSSTSARQSSSHSSHLGSGPPALASTTAGRSAATNLPQTAPAATPAASTHRQTAPSATSQSSMSVAMPAVDASTMSSYGPSTPGVASVLAASGAAGGRRPDTTVEFTTAIAYVNKIKSRFKDKADTYKQFLEILQTYQRDGKEITEVYDQVAKLFATAPDLIGEFKQFLPEDRDSSIFTSLMEGEPMEKGRRTAPGKDTKKKRAPAGDPKTAKRSKTTQKADSPSVEDEQTAMSNLPQTLASAEDVALFDKIKKYVDDKTTYHEFLKLVNLWVQDFIDLKTLLERAALFIGQSPDIWASFRRVVNADQLGSGGADPQSSQGGYGFGGMLNIDNGVAENIPMLERVKPDLSGAKVKSYGPSYRKLPKTEINLQCTGRDAMCWEVLNDEWVSHPIWAAEDSAPFMTHKKNIHEEALHKSEEERHEYDYHIEANLRTIALLEPLYVKIQTMDPEERAHFNLKAGIGGQSKSIYQRIIKKVYGKEVGPEVIKALHDNPVATLPIVLDRLKSKDEEWKKAQRDWNRVWREQDAKNFYRALDHQGIQFKANDKKTISHKNLISEADLKRREQQNTKHALVEPSCWRARPQFEFDFSDGGAMQDGIKLILSYLDRLGTLANSDRNRIEQQLREFLPHLFMISKDEFDQDFGFAGGNLDDSVDGESIDDVSMADDDETASATAARKAKKGPAAADLRMKLLKQVRERDGRDKRGATATPGPEDAAAEARDRSSVEGTPMTDQGDRAETPLPVPADPAAVAEAVEKDRAGAEASEQTWVKIDSPATSAPVSAVASETGETVRTEPRRKANFFANGNYYVLVRLIQILYSRLVICKRIANELAAEKNQPINPIAIKLGLSEPDIAHQGIEQGTNPAEHYYVHLLLSAEKLFEGELDATAFEERLRVMFGTKAYIMFTLDKVIAAIIKQVQTVIADMKSQELCALLVRDRAHEKTTTRQQIAYRMQAETVVGQDENLYKIEFHQNKSILSIQILGKEDLTVDDAETMQEKWRQYIDSYTLTHPTEGLTARIEPPFLNRSLEEVSDEAQTDEFHGEEGLSLKIALGSYRMFFIPETEDYFHRTRQQTEVEALRAKEDKYLAAAERRLKEKFDEPKQTSPAAA